jgi:leucyl aminopeptidase
MSIMSDLFITAADEQTIPIIPVIESDFGSWSEKQGAKIKNWFKINEFKGKSATVCFVPNKEGQLKQIFLGIENQNDFWAYGVLPPKLSAGTYQIKADFNKEQWQRIAIAWGLGAYKFNAYKKEPKSKAKLVVAEICNLKYIKNIVDAVCLLRDLINSPAENMGPASLAKAVLSVAIEFGANVEQIIGDDLLKKGYAAIYTVGRASNNAPRLIDLKWGKDKDPKIILVGKGVCFDSGGLDLKPAEAMLLMKKDMGGGAHALALALMIMTAELPVNLRVLIPAVENMVAGNSYKPGDVITTYKGTTVEITNTDAEGRLILADALALACQDKPDLLIDFATLTGAAKIALGTDVSALFTAYNEIADEIINLSIQENDPVCRLPLYQPYRELLDSDIADICNAPDTRLGGAITAALFLQEFVDNEIPWLHFDVMGFNLSDQPGRPKGGDARALRAVFNYLLKRYFV